MTAPEHPYTRALMAAAFDLAPTPTDRPHQPVAMRRIIAAVTSSITRPAVKTGAVNCFLGNRFEDQGPIDHRLGARHAWSAVAFAPTRRRHVAAVVEFRRQPPRRCDGPVMAIVPHSVWLAGFTALMLAAAIVDLRRLVIPNPLVGGLCVLWLLDLETSSPAISAALATVGSARPRSLPAARCCFPAG